MISIRKEYVDFIRNTSDVVYVLDAENEIGYTIDILYDIFNGESYSFFATTMESFSQILPMSLPNPNDISKIYIGDFCYFENDTGIHRADTMQEIIEKISSLT